MTRQEMRNFKRMTAQNAAHIMQKKKKESAPYIEMVKSYKADDTGATINGKKLSYSEIFYNDEETHGVFEDYAAYIIYVFDTMEILQKYNSVEELKDMRTFLLTPLESFCNSLDARKKVALINEINEVFVNNSFSIDEATEIQRILYFLIQCPRAFVSAKPPIVIFQLLLAYKYNTKLFFETVLIAAHYFLSHLCIEYMIDKEAVTYPQAYEETFAEYDKKPSNIKGIYIAKALQWYIRMSEGCSSCETDEYFNFSSYMECSNTSNIKLGWNKNNQLRYWTKKAISQCLGTDNMAKFFNTGDIRELNDRRTKFDYQIKVNDITTSMAPDMAASGLNMLINELKIKPTDDGRFPEQMYELMPELFIENNLRALINTPYSGKSLKTEAEMQDKINTLESNLKDVTDTLKAERKEAKRVKKEYEIASQRASSWEQKNATLQKEITNLKQQRNENNILTKKEQKLSETQNAEKDAEIIRLKEQLDKAQKDNQILATRYKQASAQLAALEDAEEDDDIEKTAEIDTEEMIALLNRKKVILIGGRNNLSDKLLKLGYTAFTQCESVSEAQQSQKDVDLVVICTKFCNHSMDEMAASIYSDVDRMFFNNVNAKMLINDMYMYFNEGA